MPTEPSAAVRRTTTHLVTAFEMPPLVKVPTSGMPTPKISTRSMLVFILVFLVGSVFRNIEETIGCEQRQSRWPF
jgi:hypothetical protein